MDPFQSQIIAKNPIGKRLDSFQEAFTSTCAKLNISASADAVQQVVKNGSKDLLSDLIFNFQGLPASRLLRSPDGRSTLAGELATLFSKLELNQQDLQAIVPLLTKVVEKAPDEEIWDAVYKLVTKSTPQPTPLGEWTPPAELATPTELTRPETPPNPPPDSALKSPTFDTPAQPNSGTSLSESQIRDEIDRYLRLELADAVYTNVHGFGTRFGEQNISAHWECATNCTSECAKRTKCPTEWNWNDDIVRRLPSWPKYPSEEAVLDWFGRFNDLGFERSFYGSGRKELGDSNSKSKRQCDIFLSPTILDDQNQAASPPRTYQHSWHNVLIPGELKSSVSENGKAEMYVQLASYVREVFGAQRGRRYVHAFSICGHMMRCYIFDRGGGSISNSFSIGKNQKTFNLFVQILLSYVRMSPTLLGFDPTIQTESGQVFLPIQKSLGLPNFVIICGRRFRLRNVVFHQSAIVSRGTTCWMATDEVTGEVCLVKDAWRSYQRGSEGKLFALAKERGVRGLPDCRLYEDVKVDNILDDLQANVRKGLIYGSSKVVKFPQKSGDRDWASTFDSDKAGTSRLNRLKLTEKDEEDNDNSTGPLSSTSRGSPLKNTIEGEDKDADLVSSTSKLSLRKRVSALLHPMKKGSVRGKPKNSIEKQMEDGNRIHTRLVFYTIGREIYRFQSIQELLEAFHGAINCHWSLVKDGRILHRDVSITNIMIANNPRNGELKGFLIDLDMAKMIGSDGSGAMNRTGTMEFMAINVLRRSEPHSYRDDLESFFYVLIWICVMYTSTGDRHYIRDAENQKRLPRVLNGWSSGFAAEVKDSQMSKELTFQDILGGFSDGFRELESMMKEIRRLLFPSQGEGVIAGSEVGQDHLYDAVLGAIQRQLDKMSE